MKIYSIPSKDQLMRVEAEMDYNPKNEIEHKFIRAIAELVNEALNVNHNDRRIISSLLVTTLNGPINNRGNRNNQVGLLQQYLAHELETIGKSVKNLLLIPEDVVVNHDYATHAMFSDIIEYIQKNYVRKDDIHSDGTFETIIEKRNELIGDGTFPSGDRGSIGEACGCESER